MHKLVEHEKNPRKQQLKRRRHDSNQDKQQTSNIERDNGTRPESNDPITIITHNLSKEHGSNGAELKNKCLEAVIKVNERKINST